jgi:hypothetical protein
MLYPATTEVDAVQVSDTEWATATTPVPERAMAAGELEALLATVMLPVKLPAADGVKVTCNAALWPGARIKPAETPLAVNLAPETLTPEMVTLEFPAFVSVTLSVLLAPAETFPKFKLPALLLRSAAAATPVPLMATVLGVLETLLITDIVPVTAPVVLGANTIFKMACFAALIVMGKLPPEIVNPFAAVLACVMVSGDPPGLDMVTDCETVPPTATDPKFTAAGVIEIEAAPGVELAGFGAPVNPIHPEIESVPQNNRSRAARRVALRWFDFPRAAGISAPPRIVRMKKNMVFIAWIVLAGGKTELLSESTAIGQALSS